MRCSQLPRLIDPTRTASNTWFGTCCCRCSSNGGRGSRCGPTDAADRQAVTEDPGVPGRPEPLSLPLSRVIPTLSTEWVASALDERESTALSLPAPASPAFHQ